MSYLLTEKKARVNAVCRRMREGKERKRLERITDLVPRINFTKRKDLRKVLVLIDLDFGVKVDIFKFHDKSRIDSYRVLHNGGHVGDMGWSNFCKRLSGHCPRLLSPTSLEY